MTPASPAATAWRRSGEPPLRAGMTATVTIDIGRKRSLAGLFGASATAASRP